MTKIKEKSDEINNTNWKIIVQSFVANMISRANDNISKKIQEWLGNIKRMTIGILLMFVGFIFVLICLVMYINVFIDNESQWAGYGIVGATVLIIGYLMSRK